MKRFFLITLLSFVAFNMGFFSDAQMDQMKGMEGGKMNMPMQKTSSGNKAPEGQVPVTLTPHKQKLVGVKTQPVRQKTMNKLIRTIGRVDYNERTLTTVTTKIEGWIEDLNIDATGMAVKKGAPLFSVYSPKLLQTQEEYLLAIASAKKMKNKMGSGVMAQASRKRLLLWDVKPEQIRNLETRSFVPCPCFPRPAVS